jgi:RNA polymerase sigma-70 factor (ECF subfamily)
MTANTARTEPRTSINGLRARADELDGTRMTGRFVARATLGDDRVPDRVVSAAVARAKTGDREALRFLYVRFADNVYGYVCSILRDEHDAEDVTQQVFAKLMTVLVKYEERDVPFAAWILRVARNVALDHARQRRPLPCEEIRDVDVHDDFAGARERSIALHDALRALPEAQREVVLLRLVLGLTPGEIAGRLSRTEPSVHGLNHRARGALQQALAGMGCEPTVAPRVAA